ncbi:hypothetical protein ACFL6H_05085 [Candidatus Latescibacterota bacterium]
MTKTVRIFIVLLNMILIIAVFLSNCSREISTSYEELERTGRIEPFARETYKDFFEAVHKFEQAYSDPSGVQQDSSLIHNASKLTDELIENIRQFPLTHDSRIAMDALSYASKDLAESPGFDSKEIYDFWEYAFMKPLFTFAKNYKNSNKVNENAHFQLIKVLRRGMGTRTTDQMVVDCINIVGVVPSTQVMEYCETDSLVFKKIHDLIIYTRSLQKVDPPVWMLSGAWFLSIEFSTLPEIFIALVPNMVDDVPFLSFKDYQQGEVYAAVFDDPIPVDKTKWESWLARADGVMRSLRFDTSFAERVRNSGLSTVNTHNFYDDYLFHTEIDTTRNEFSMSFLRKKDQISAFEFTGMDSIAVIFSADSYNNPEEDVFELFATRIIGASMASDQYIPAQNFTGRAFLMPLGVHDKSKIAEYEKTREPEFDIQVNTPNN